jgi:tol-pal system protein YbgF
MWVTRKTPFALILLAVATNASAVSKAELEQRIAQLERRLESRSLLDMLDQLTTLQREVQELRGRVEEQGYALEGIQKRQRDLYLDIDRRMHRLEAGGVTQTPAAGPGLAPAAGGYGDTQPGGTTAPGAASIAPAAAPASAPVAAGQGAPALNPAEERKAYDQGLELLKEGRYSDAATAFQNFLKQYPGSGYADNAQYWLGEVYYVTRDFDAALTEFNKVLTGYTGSAKAADAKLKMGYIQYERKDWAKARELLGQVVSTWPGTTSARLAQERLDRMKKEGH